MRFSNVRLILAREIRDQLRDRRTLFMIVVLPILLYPLLGMSMFQIAQFTQEQPTKVLVAGAEKIADRPPLFEKGWFAWRWFGDPSRAKLMELEFASCQRAEAQSQVQSGKYAAALYFPPDFAARLEAFRATMGRQAEKRTAKAAGPQAVRLEVPGPEILYSTASDKSQIAFARLSDVLRRWTDQIGDENLAASGVPKLATRPFLVESADVADKNYRGASLWSKLLPVLLLIWALTGAFYPAVDLCAGEKERGTLETLLSSRPGAAKSSSASC
jgi:sodium transport system permease protein